MIFFPGRLAQQREALVALSAAQRAEIAAALVPSVRKLAAADRALEMLRSHPFLAGALAAALGYLGPRRLIFWVARALPVYSLLRRSR